MGESACVYVMEVYISTVCSIPPLLTSSADSLQSSNVTRTGTLQTGKRQKRGHAQENSASCSKKRAMSPQKAGMCVSTESQWDRVHVCGGREVYISTVCSIPPLLTSSADSLQSDDAILSQKVYGELVILVSRSQHLSGTVCTLGGISGLGFIGREPQTFAS